MTTQQKLFDVSAPDLGRPADEAPDKFEIIYCDPPWSYQGQVMRGAHKVASGCAEDHYPTMTLAQLKQMKVQDIAADNSLCIMWTTGPQLANSMELLAAWGFAYVQIGFMWHKQRIMPSAYFLSSVELAIIGKRGSIPKPRGCRSQQQFLSRARTGHSVKPDEFRLRIDRAWPDQTKLELFSRSSAPGWWSWGNEAAGSLAIPALDAQSMALWRTLDDARDSPEPERLNPDHDLPW